MSRWHDPTTEYTRRHPLSVPWKRAFIIGLVKSVFFFFSILFIYWLWEAAAASGEHQSKKKTLAVQLQSRYLSLLPRNPLWDHVSICVLKRSTVFPKKTDDSQPTSESASRYTSWDDSFLKDRGYVYCQDPLFLVICKNLREAAYNTYIYNAQCRTKSGCIVEW